MTDKTIKWMNVATNRAAHIPSSEWERHREELCRLYSTMTLEDVMAIMKIRWQFCPSKRQYITQFQKWNNYKYSRKEDQVMHITEGNHDFRASLFQDPPQQLRLDQVLTISKTMPHDKQQLSDRKPPVPAKKSKLIGVTAQHLSAQSSPPNLPAIQVNSDYVGSVMNLDMVSLTEQPSPDPSDLMELDEENSGLQTDSLRLLPGDDDAGSTELDQLTDAKLAADFLFATKLYKHSFELYSRLLKWLEFHPEFKQHVTPCIVGCARSVSTPSQALAIRSILERKIADGIYRSQDHARTALFRLLLSDICANHGDKDAAKTQRRLAQQQSDYFSGNSEQPRQSFDLVTYKYFIKEHKKKGHNFSSRDITKHFVQPGSSAPEEGYIRSCLKWCISQMKNDWMVHGSWRNIMSNGTLEFETHNTALFSELWQRWQQQDRGLNDYGRPCQTPTLWAEQMERRMGISPAEFLMIMSRAISRAYPSVFGFLTIDTIVDMIECKTLVEEKRIVRRALFAAEELNKLSDDDLVSTFLEAYLDHYRPMARHSGAREYRNLSRNYVKSYLQNSLQIQLPDDVDNESDHDSNMDTDASMDGYDDINGDVIAAFDQDCLSVSSDALLFPTLARSLSSADLNSLKSLKARIEGNLGDHVPQYRKLSQYSIDDSHPGGALGNPSIASVVGSVQNSMEMMSIRFRNGLTPTYSVLQQAF